MLNENKLEQSDFYDKALSELLNRTENGELSEDFLSIRDQGLIDIPLIPSWTGPPTKRYIEAHEADTDADVEWVPQFKKGPINTDYLAKREIEFGVDEVKKGSHPLRNVEELTSDTTNHSHDPADDIKSRTPLDYWVTQHFIGRNIVKCFADKIFIYNGHHGFFEELSDVELNIAIRKGLPPGIDMKLGKYKLGEVVHRLRSSPDLQVEHDAFDRHAHLVNFKDCVLDTKSLETYSHSPDYLFTSFINAEYGMDTPTVKVYHPGHISGGRYFDKFIQDCTEGDPKKIRCLQQLTGYIISNEWRAKKFFVLVGLPHTGKSLWLTLWRTLIGDGLTTAMTFRQLSENRFMTAELFQSKLNVTAELDESTHLKGIDILKTLTGGDLLTAERKNERAFRFVCKTKMVAAGNQMPMMKLDGTSAFTDRILFLTFNNTISENRRDKSLMEKLLAEKSYIVRWAIDGLRELFRNNLVFTESNEAWEFKQQYMNDLNNVPDFVSNYCIVDINQDKLRVHRRFLYPAYTDYCRDNGFRALSKDEFYVEIKRSGVTPAKFRIGNSQPLWGFKGIELIPSASRNKQEE